MRNVYECMRTITPPDPRYAEIEVPNGSGEAAKRGHIYHGAGSI